MSVAAETRGLAVWRLLASWDAVRRAAVGSPGLLIRIAYVEMVGIALLYVTGAISVIVGTAPLSSTQVEEVARKAPVVGGLIVSLVGWLGLRSGSRGGPLSVERPFVSLVLLSPLGRRAALMRGAARHLAISIGLGAFLGAAVGIAFSLRMRGSPFLFAMSAGAGGALTALVYSGSALIACGKRFRTGVADVIGLVATLLAATALVMNLPVWPFGAAASVALVPAGAQVSPLGLALPLGLVFAGLVTLEAADIERLRRRSELVGLIGFAAGGENFRQAWSAYRRLAGERARRNTLLRFSRQHLRWAPVLRRDIRSALRWPVIRLLRILALALAVALAVVAASSTTVLLAAAGLAATLLALDCCEGLSQDADHPQMWENLPVSRRRLLVEHLVLPAVLISAAASFAVACLALWLGPQVLGHTWAGLLGVVAALAMAAASIAANRPSVRESPYLMEMIDADSTGLVTLTLFGVRYLGPPIVVGLALSPAVLPARLSLPFATLGLAIALAALGRRLWTLR